MVIQNERRLGMEYYANLSWLLGFAYLFNAYLLVTQCLSTHCDFPLSLMTIIAGIFYYFMLARLLCYTATSTTLHCCNIIKLTFKTPFPSRCLCFTCFASYSTIDAHSLDLSFIFHYTQQ